MQQPVHNPPIHPASVGVRTGPAHVAQMSSVGRTTQADIGWQRNVIPAAGRNHRIILRRKNRRVHAYLIQTINGRSVLVILVSRLVTRRRGREELIKLDDPPRNRMDVRQRKIITPQRRVDHMVYQASREIPIIPLSQRCCREEIDTGLKIDRWTHGNRAKN